MPLTFGVVAEQHLPARALLVGRAMRVVSVCVSSLLAFGCVTDAADDSVDTDEAGLSAIKARRGVDRAGAFSVHEARILAREHRVKWTGVYIGGACNAGSGWTKEVVASIHDATHWQFMPIWVGQQSPAICGAHTLTFARGEADGAAAASRMHAFGWGANKDIPIALDVEGGTYAYAPHGSTAYVHGWVKAVHAAGYFAYVYSSESGIEHFHDAKVGVDAGWVASWYYSRFHAATPAGIHLGKRYTHHDRAWQYAGDFHVRGVGNVDANTSDLLLAPGPGGTNVGAIAADDDDDDAIEDAAEDEELP